MNHRVMLSPDQSMGFKFKTKPIVPFTWIPTPNSADPTAQEDYFRRLLILFGPPWRNEETLAFTTNNYKATWNHFADQESTSSDENRRNGIADVKRLLGQYYRVYKSRDPLSEKEICLANQDSSLLTRTTQQAGGTIMSTMKSTPEREVAQKLSTLNAAQSEVFHMMRHKYLNPATEPPIYVCVTGEPGVGKTFLIRRILEFFNNSIPEYDSTGLPVVLALSFTAQGAKEMGGVTINSALNLQFDYGTKVAEYNPLQAVVQCRLKNVFEKLQFVLIDEISVVNAELLMAINLRLIEITGNSDPFGGMNIVAFGDFCQNPIFAGTPVYKTIPPNEQRRIFKNVVELPALWDLFTFYPLTINVRQSEDKVFANLLHILRTSGTIPVGELAILKKRVIPSNVGLTRDFAERWNPYDHCRNGVLVAQSNDTVRRHNAEILNRVYALSLKGKFGSVHTTTKTFAPITIKAITYNSDGELETRITAVDDKYFPPCAPFNLKMAINARVAMTVNMAPLCNSQLGRITKFFHNKTTCEVDGIEVMFEEMEAPIVVPRYTTIGFGWCSNYIREQFPLTLAFCSTSYKVQGTTQASVHVDVNDLIKHPAALYVALSRVKKVEQVFLSNMFRTLDPLPDAYLVAHQIASRPACYKSGTIWDKKQLEQGIPRILSNALSGSPAHVHDDGPAASKPNDAQTVKERKKRHSDLVDIPFTESGKKQRLTPQRSEARGTSDVIGQGFSLSNTSGTICWLNASINLLYQLPAFVHMLEMEQLTPEFTILRDSLLEENLTAFREHEAIVEGFDDDLHSQIDAVDYLTHFLQRHRDIQSTVSWNYEITPHAGCRTCGTSQMRGFRQNVDLIRTIPRPTERAVQAAVLESMLLSCGRCGRKYSQTINVTIPPSLRHLFVVINSPNVDGGNLEFLHELDDDSIHIFGVPFELCAIMSRIGESGEFGHFFTRVKNRGATFVEFNDSSINYAVPSATAVENAYVALFRRLDADPNPIEWRESRVQANRADPINKPQPASSRALQGENIDINPNEILPFSNPNNSYCWLNADMNAMWQMREVREFILNEQMVYNGLPTLRRAIKAQDLTEYRKAHRELRNPSNGNAMLSTPQWDPVDDQRDCLDYIWDFISLFPALMIPLIQFEVHATIEPCIQHPQSGRATMQQKYEVFSAGNVPKTAACLSAENGKINMLALLTMYTYKTCSKCRNVRPAVRKVMRERMNHRVMLSPDQSMGFKFKTKPIVPFTWIPTPNSADPTAQEDYFRRLLILFGPPWRNEETLAFTTNNYKATWNHFADQESTSSDENRRNGIADVKRLLGQYYRVYKSRDPLSEKEICLANQDSSLLTRTTQQAGGTIMSTMKSTPEREVAQKLSTLNAAQSEVFHMMRHKYLNPATEPPIYVCVTGEPGVGKTFLIRRILEFFNNSIPEYDSTGLPVVLALSFTAQGAKEMGGVTINSALNLQFDYGTKVAEYNPLQAVVQCRLKNVFEKLQFVLIDEISVVNAELLMAINLRLIEITGNSDPFGGMNIVAFGDFCQNPIFAGTPVYKTIPPNEQRRIFKNVVELPALWDLFTFYPLTINVRQSEDKVFANLLHILRTSGTIPVGELAILKKRVIPSNVGLTRDFAERWNPYDHCRNGVLVAQSNDTVRRHNAEILNRVYALSLKGKFGSVHTTTKTFAPITIKAITYNSDGELETRITAVDDKYFPPCAPFNLKMAINARVAMTVNMAPLCNSQLGRITKFFHNKTTCEVDGIEVMFEEMEAPIVVPRYTTIGFGWCSNYIREQFPLTLAFCSTSYKVQGTTQASVHVDVNDLIKHPAALYVALSRVKKVEQVFLSNMFRTLDPLPDAYLVAHQIASRPACYKSGTIWDKKQLEQGIPRILSNALSGSPAHVHDDGPAASKPNDAQTVKERKKRHSDLVDIPFTESGKKQRLTPQRSEARGTSDVIGQGFSLSNTSGTICWLNASINLLYQLPAFVHMLEMEQLTPEFTILRDSLLEENLTAFREHEAIVEGFDDDLHSQIDAVDYLTHFLQRHRDIQSTVSWNYEITPHAGCRTCGTSQMRGFRQNVDLIRTIPRPTERAVQAAVLESMLLSCGRCGRKYSQTINVTIPPSLRHLFVVINSPNVDGGNLEFLHELDDDSMHIFGVPFELCAIMSRIGESGEFGHFFTRVKNRGATFVEFNDSSINYAVPSATAVENAYVALFRRLDADPNPIEWRESRVQANRADPINKPQPASSRALQGENIDINPNEILPFSNPNNSYCWLNADMNAMWQMREVREFILNEQMVYNGLPTLRRAIKAQDLTEYRKAHRELRNPSNGNAMLSTPQWDPVDDQRDCLDYIWDFISLFPALMIPLIQFEVHATIEPCIQHPQSGRATMQQKYEVFSAGNVPKTAACLSAENGKINMLALLTMYTYKTCSKCRNVRPAVRKVMRERMNHRVMLSPDQSMGFKFKTKPIVPFTWIPTPNSADPTAQEDYFRRLLILFGPPWRNEETLAFTTNNYKATWNHFADQESTSSDENRRNGIADVKRLLGQYYRVYKSRDPLSEKEICLANQDSSLLTRTTQQAGGTIMSTMKSTPEREVAQKLSTLNAAQSEVFHMMRHKYLNPATEPPIYVCVTGEPGVGKTFLIRRILEFFNNSIPEYDSTGLPVVLALSFTAQGAKEMGGVTINSALNLQFDYGTKVAEYNPLQAVVQCRLKNVFEKLQFVLIDEISVVNAELLMAINLRLIEITGNSDPFGGMNIVAFGDFCQNPIFAGTPVYKTIPPNEQRRIFKNVVELPALWDLFTFYPLTINVRQSEDKVFANLLHILRTSGTIPVGELAILKKRVIPSNVGLTRDFAERWNPYDHCRNGVLVAQSNDTVRRHNAEILNRVYALSLKGKFGSVHTTTKTFAPITIKAITYNSDGELETRITAVDDKYFPPCAPFNLKMAINARVAMTVNMAPLCNSQLGRITKFFHNKTTCEVDGIEVMFEEMEAPIVVPRYTTIGFGWCSNYIREQFPLTLAFCSTSYKVQGTTQASVHVDVNDLIKHPAALYVALSRVKKVEQVFLSNMFRTLDPLPDAYLVAHQIASRPACYKSGTIWDKKQLEQGIPRILSNALSGSPAHVHDDGPAASKPNDAQTVKERKKRHSDLVDIPFTESGKKQRLTPQRSEARGTSDVIGQGFSLSNTSGTICWLNASINLLYQLPAFVHMLEMEQLTPEFTILRDSLLEENLTAFREHEAIVEGFDDDLHSQIDAVDYLTHFLQRHRDIQSTVSWNYEITPHAGCRTCGTSQMRGFRQNVDLIRTIPRPTERAVQAAVLESMLLSCGRCGRKYSQTINVTIPPSLRHLFVVINSPNVDGGNLEFLHELDDDSIHIFGVPFELCAIMSRIGESGEFGHFFTRVKNRGATFVEFNDSSINYAVPSATAVENAYVALFRRLDADPNPIEWRESRVQANRADPINKPQPASSRALQGENIDINPNEILPFSNPNNSYCWLNADMNAMWQMREVREFILNEQMVYNGLPTLRRAIKAQDLTEYRKAHRELRNPSNGNAMLSTPQWDPVDDQRDCLDYIWDFISLFPALMIPLIQFEVHATIEPCIQHPQSGRATMQQKYEVFSAGNVPKTAACLSAENGKINMLALLTMYTYKTCSKCRNVRPAVRKVMFPTTMRYLFVDIESSQTLSLLEEADYWNIHIEGESFEICCVLVRIECAGGHHYFARVFVNGRIYEVDTLTLGPNFSPAFGRRRPAPAVAPRAPPPPPSSLTFCA
ncbi:unnamed protein product [Bursaphelenchus xylophilus]|uniref:ATP-dependent DNA helicase n=1 Tax=Bursaphelenchus xylophilus TaxID=6326 RepID=A0A811M210_BURXY|nr:unnamed protein product [Bursaphelenchus xylophilus]CAG9127957.1 unnamed protein product [Bursaphelenchus xylophilus]